MTIRKWDAEIRAWLDGAELEYETHGSRGWQTTFTLNPMTDPEVTWRVKPSDEDAAVEKWHKEIHQSMLCCRNSFLEGFRAAKALYVNTTG